MGLLLCDLDDTVLDRAAAFRRWVDQFLASRRLDPELGAWLIEVDEWGYRGRRQFFTLVKERLDLPETVENLTTCFHQEFASFFTCDGPTRTALERARRKGWRVVIVTNGRPSQEAKILATGLDKLVDAWCISGVEGCAKPALRLLQIAAERCGRPLDAGWMIGDNPECDIGAAHAAGIPSVWLHHRRTWPLADFAPTHQAGSFPEAVDLAIGAGGSP